MNEVMLFVVVWNSKGQHMSSFAFPYENSSAAIDAFNTHKRSKLHSDPTYNVQGTLSFPDGEIIKLDGEGRERQSLEYFSCNPDKCFINPWTGRFTKMESAFTWVERHHSSWDFVHPNLRPTMGPYEVYTVKEAEYLVVG